MILVRKRIPTVRTTRARYGQGNIVQQLNNKREELANVTSIIGEKGGTGDIEAGDGLRMSGLVLHLNISELPLA